MRLNLLLVATAVIYIAAGLALTFAGGEAIVAIGARAEAVEIWMAQIAGAGLLGVGWLNWLQRYAVVGGILGRPVLLMNLVFAATTAGASATAWRHTGSTTALVATLVLGAVFVAFGLRLFRPAPTSASHGHRIG